jgi:hypothetical protein
MKVGRNVCVVQQIGQLQRGSDAACTARRWSGKLLMTKVHSTALLQKLYPEHMVHAPLSDITKKRV